MFSFTGSRGSFRGDTNFYGKNVRKIDVVFDFIMHYFSLGYEFLYASKNRNFLMATRRCNTR